MSSITISRSPNLTIGIVSERAGVHIETIRYYEKIGLLANPERSSGGHRIYDPEQIKRLNFIRRSRELGFALDQIATSWRSWMAAVTPVTR